MEYVFRGQGHLNPKCNTPSRKVRTRKPDIGHTKSDNHVDRCGLSAS